MPKKRKKTSAKKKITKKEKRSPTKRKTSTKKKAIKRIIHSIKHETDERLEKVLIENFVSLQKVMTTLIVKFDHLGDKIGKLLDIFEISAKALAKKDFDLGKSDKEILAKLDNLAEQNKTIARGLTLIHERGGEEEYYAPEEQMEAPGVTGVQHGMKPREMEIQGQGAPPPTGRPSILTPKPIPGPGGQQPPPQMVNQEEQQGVGGYSKSISSGPQEPQEA